MGIHDRDYYRDESPAWTWGRWGVTIWLIVITAVVFVLQMVGRDLARGAGDRTITSLAIYDPRAILKGEVWRLVTPIFLHGGIFHLACNMLVLYWAGSRLEDRYGSREFLLFYLISGTFANTVYLLMQVAGVTEPALSLGASGSVMAVFVLFACHHPREQILLMGIVPMRVWLLLVLYLGFDIMGALGDRNTRGVAYFVHLAGALFGFVYYRINWRLASLLPGSRRRPRERDTPRLRVLPAEPHGPDDIEQDTPEPVGAAVEAPPRASEAEEALEVKLDRVLEKVSKYGQESLTPEERAILFRASEVYKKRRK